MKIRHVKNLPPMSFGVSDKRIAATIEKMEGGKTSQSFLFSNEPLYIDHFNSIFEELWRNGVDAQRRIEDIEADIKLDADIDVIPNTVRAHELYYQLVRFAKQEILLLLPTVNVFTRQVKIVKEALLYRAEQKNEAVLSSNGGTIQIRIKIRILMPLPTSELAHRKFNTITISTKQDNSDNQAIINVKDTGSGIDSEILPELFSKFTTRSFSGTGLGLFISKSIIEAHGGKIWAENNKDGKGTTFTFSLPLPIQY